MSTNNSGVPDNQINYSRSMAMLMLAAVDELYGKDCAYGVRVHFVVSGGLYCTLQDPEKCTKEFLDTVSDKMRRIQASGRCFTLQTMRTRDARELFEKKELPSQGNLLRYRRASRTNIYRMGDFIGYSYSPIIRDTSLLGRFALTPYEDGFVLQFGDGSEGDVIPQFAPDEKLFSVQKNSLEWGKYLGIETISDLNQQIITGHADDLILTMEAFQEREIAKIAEQIAADPNKKIVLIAGPSSSGKTTFSHRLSAQLSVYGLRPHPIPVDDYFKNREDTPLDENGNYNFECLEAIDVEGFNRDMQNLLEGEVVELPTFNFKTGRREYKGKTCQLGNRDILVIEGIHCLNDALSYSLPRESKCKIYISALTQLNLDEHNRIATTDGRLIRRIVRDARTRGISAAGTIKMWPSVRRGEQNYIFPHQETADIMFNSALIYELSVLKIYAEPILFAIDEDDEVYEEAKRLLKFLEYFVPLPADKIPNNSLVREFVGGGCFDI